MPPVENAKPGAQRCSKANVMNGLMNCAPRKPMVAAQKGAFLIISLFISPTVACLGLLDKGGCFVYTYRTMAGRPFHLICPKVIAIRLSGKLRPWVTAKDVILTVLEHFTVKGNVNTVFEYTGEGVAALDVPERATICNMGAECGVTSSLFPSDQETLRFLTAQNRAQDWKPLCADADARYDGEFVIKLDEVTCKAACPHSPGNIKDIKDLAGMKVDQVLIGSCTNSSYTDLAKAAEILSGHVVFQNREDKLRTIGEGQFRAFVVQFHIKPP